MTCGHTTLCDTCGQCSTCNADKAAQLDSQYREISLALGRAATREEQLRGVIASGVHNPVERGERDLAFARLAIMRRKIEAVLNTPLHNRWPEEIQAVLNYDSTMRGRSIEEVVAEAGSLRAPPPPPKAGS